MSTLGKIANGINDDLILFGGENVNLLSRFPGGTHTLHHTWVKHTELQPNL